MRRIFIALVLLSCGAGTYAADNTPNRNLVSLAAAAKEDVASDLLIVQLFVEHDGRDQAKAANQVNQDMAAALASAKQTKGIKAQTLDYRSDPIYDEQQKISAWRVHQGLRLESADHDGLIRRGRRVGRPFDIPREGHNEESDGRFLAHRRRLRRGCGRQVSKQQDPRKQRGVHSPDPAWLTKFHSAGGCRFRTGG